MFVFYYYDFDPLTKFTIELFDPEPSLVDLEVFLRLVPDNVSYNECLSLLEFAFSHKIGILIFFLT